MDIDPADCPLAQIEPEQVTDAVGQALKKVLNIDIDAPPELSSAPLVNEVINKTSLYANTRVLQVNLRVKAKFDNEISQLSVAIAKYVGKGHITDESKQEGEKLARQLVDSMEYILGTAGYVNE